MSRVAKLFRRSPGEGRQYNFTKAGVVLKIKLLDNTSVEFAISTSETGGAVLEKVGKAISLSEVLFFGLKYRTSANSYRWVDREKSVRDQLKRHADRSHDDVLHLAVQYFVHDINLLPDEMSRYQYYLQLKKLILSRRLLCGLDQGIILASYALQAEFGDHDREVHTVDFLSDFDLFPSELLNDIDQPLVMRKVADLHQKNHGLSPARAEACYIKQAQLLPTYGIEFFPAKDINNLGLLLGASFVGVIVRHANGLPPVSFRWADILSIRPKSGKHGGQLQIETPTEYIYFRMENVENAHYVWHFFILQHTFFRKIATMTSSTGSLTKNVRQEFSLDQGERYENGDSARGVQRKLTITRTHGRNKPDGAKVHSLDSTNGVDGNVQRETPMDIPHLSSPDGMRTRGGATAAASTYAAFDSASSSRDSTLDSPRQRAASLDHVTASGGSQYAVVNKHNRNAESTRVRPQSTSPISNGSSDDQPPPVAPRPDLIHEAGRESPLSGSDSVVARRGKLDLSVSSDGNEEHRRMAEVGKQKRFSAAAVTSHGLWNQVLSGSAENLLAPETSGSPTSKQDPPSISPASPRSEQCKLLHDHMRVGNIYQEFDDIYRKNDSLTCDDARKPENIPRNRFRDISPYDESRVVLNKHKNPEGNDYVNASHVQIEVGDKCHHYIAAQAPLPGTIADFWQMIWEQEISIIAMVTMLFESKREKCAAYWPEDADSGEDDIIYGQAYRVKMTSAGTVGQAVTRMLRVTHLSSGKSRKITHLQFLGWPDHGVPQDTKGFLDYLGTIRGLRRSQEEGPGNNTSGSGGDGAERSGSQTPIMVHCSAGIGRTGVTILLDCLVTAIEENQPIDIPQVLRRMRDQRAHFVQNAGQYKMIYETLIKYLEGERLV